MASSRKRTNGAVKKKVLGLTKAQNDKLKAEDAELGEMKMQLANIELQIMALESQKVSLATSLAKKSEGWRKKLEEAAETVGIDPDPKKGKWRFDLDAGAFIRVS